MKIKPGEAQIREAFEGVTKEFYRPANVARRWVKFLLAQRRWVSLRSLFFRLGLGFAVYVMLSFFQ